MIDRGAFFASVRVSFGRLSQAQVDGFNAILDEWKWRGGGDKRHLAYMLATCWHETATTMQPIREIGGIAYFTRMYDIKGARPAKARELGNLKPGDGAKFCGRGYVQLTGRSNYVKAGRAIGVDLIAFPDAAMKPEIAAKIMFVGMAEGWFTGRKLSHYFSDKADDAVHARRIINGLDCASQVAGYHAKFLNAIREIEGVASPPDVEPLPGAINDMVREAQAERARSHAKPSLWARFLSFFA